MTSPMLSAMCLLAFLFHGAAGSLVLDVTPSNISPGLTKSLTINCTFSYAEATNISSIISLVVSKSNQQEQFIDLVSVNVFSPEEITKFSEVDGQVSGHMDPDHESYLSIVWTYPSVNVTGLYKCEINGMDSHGRPSGMSQSSLVTSQKLDLDQLIDKVSQLQRQLESQENIAKNQSVEITALSALAKDQSNEIALLQSELKSQENLAKNQSIEVKTLSALANNQSDEINKLFSLTNTQSNIISTQQSQLDKQANTISDLQKNLTFKNLINILMTNEIFHFPSMNFNGHVYILSKQDWTDSTVSSKTCQDYGGYLAQINNYNENQFVKDFLNRHIGIDAVLINGTDSQHEGRWTYTDTDTDLVFYDWGIWEPDGGQSYNCIYLDISTQWQWGDWYCTHSYTNYKFLCELETV